MKKGCGFPSTQQPRLHCGRVVQFFRLSLSLPTCDSPTGPIYAPASIPGNVGAQPRVNDVNNRRGHKVSGSKTQEPLRTGVAPVTGVIGE